MLNATATPTALSQDEYEDPREIRTVKVNRGPKAQRSALAAAPTPGARIKKSVFGQMFGEMKLWLPLDQSLRRSYVGKGHGGQKRAFKVKFLGEGVNDYGGPYRAVFEQVVDELQAEMEGQGACLLPFFKPSPNRLAGDKDGPFVLTTSKEPRMLDYLSFIGRIVGVAVRHGMQLGISLPTSFWKSLAGLRVGSVDLASFDRAALEEAKSSMDDSEAAGTCATRLLEAEPQIRALVIGLASVLPLELFHLFDAEELQSLVCGSADVNVNFLKSVTEYDGVTPTDPHVVMFWEVLSELSGSDRAAFLKFVWARTRLPSSANYLPMPFKLQKSSVTEDPDSFLPTAQTCFFSLSLPRYTSKEVLRAKLLYAIHHSPNMDADVRLNNAEGWADV